MNFWTLVEPGLLALEGTTFRIKYEVKPDSNFSIYQGERIRGRTMTLMLAKLDAERFQKELLEIGAA